MFDPEKNDTILVDTSNKKVRDRYRSNYLKNVQEFKSTFIKSGADTISIHSQKPYINELHSFFRKRIMMK
jgi:3-isopropylmalate dehydratase small subunit